MTVKGRNTAAMVDDDRITVTGNPAGIYNDTTVCCMDRSSVVYTNIDARMENSGPKIGWVR